MIQYDQIKPYIEKKLVSEQVHPEDENVRIFNYTQHCQFEGAWDEITKQCRGLILNIKTGEIIARPFSKFFNYQEHIAKGWEIPLEKPIVSEKMDGSLGILYWLRGKPYIATRGSFMSDQAQWATSYFRTYVERTGLNEGSIFTHLFEIIYPENRIVVNYDFSDLVYLTSINKENGYATTIDYPFRKVKNLSIDNVENLLKMDWSNSEGFVLYYPEANLRMKIKFPEYVRLHKIVTGLSEIGIWEVLKEEGSLSSFLENVPDEFFNWVTKISFGLNYKYADILTLCKNDFLAINQAGRSRKDIARDFQERKYPSVLFAMLDDKKYSQIIWKMIRPRGQSIYKVDIDQ